MSKRWGTPTWYFLHTLSEKIYDDCYVKMKSDVITIIETILVNLPCPLCRNHAINYLKKNNIYKVNSKNEMKTYLFKCHNWVNKRVGNSLKERKILELYKKANTVNIYKYFIQEFFRTNVLSKDFFIWRKNSLKNKLNNLMTKNKLYIAP